MVARGAWVLCVLSASDRVTCDDCTLVSGLCPSLLPLRRRGPEPAREAPLRHLESDG